MNTQIKDLIKVFNDGKASFSTKVRLTERICFDEDTGWLYCNDVILGNVGVQYYKGYEIGFHDENATIEVHRKVEDVLDEESLKTAEGIPITLRHPKKLLDSYTATEHIRGAVYGEIKNDGENIISNLVIYDKELIDMVAPEDEQGVRKLNDEFRDLSLGYKSILVPLNDSGLVYKQTKIRYNHVAVLENGRQVNATIRDTANDEINQDKGVKTKMGLFARLKGKKVLKNEETKETTIVDEETEIEVDLDDIKKVIGENEEKQKEETPTLDENNEVKKEVKDENDPKENKTEKEKETTMKDKKYFMDALIEAQKLPNGTIKDVAIADIEKEFADAFPEDVAKIVEAKKQKEVEIKDSANPEIKPVNNENEYQFNDTDTFDYRAFENETKNYYRKLTDPFSHNSWKEFNDHYVSEQRKGRMLIQ